MQPLILYGVPLSQPVRAVMWLLILKKMPFEMVLINPGSKGEIGSRHPNYLAKNPSGTIPCIEEPDSGFTLGEAHAIMTYLANKHGWTDVYPQEPHLRATIDSYLHYHHRNIRDASLGLVAPKIRKDLDIPEVIQESARRTVTAALKTLESGWLADSKFLVGDTVTLADIAAYEEIGQLGPQHTNVFDMTGFPRIEQWLADVSAVDGHDEVHVVLSELGDISTESPSMERIVAANKSALRVLKKTLAEISAR